MSLEISIARKYADALFKIASKQRIMKEVGKNLASLLSAIAANQKYQHMMFGRFVPAKTKFVFFNTMIKGLPLKEEVVRLCIVLLRNNRFYLFNQIVKSYNELIMQFSNIKSVFISSAYDLSTDEKKNLKAALMASLNCDIVITYDTNPSLLGGVIIRYGSIMLDISILRKLHKMKKYLLDDSSMEISEAIKASVGDVVK